MLPTMGAKCAGELSHQYLTSLLHIRSPIKEEHISEGACWIKLVDLFSKQTGNLRCILFSTILHVLCTVLDGDCNGRCVGTHAKNVEQCHSLDSGTIIQKCQTKCLRLLQQSFLVGIIPGFKVQVQQFTTNFSLIRTNKLIFTKAGNFDKASKPCRLNYSNWNVLTM